MSGNYDPIPKQDLSSLPFESLHAGMKFNHLTHGEQIILDLGRGQLGPTIRFHNCPVYNGETPQSAEEEDETSIFQLIAQNTFPHSAEEWEYLGEASPEEIAVYGWRWFEVSCLHCGMNHRFLTREPAAESRRCRACGMVFNRFPEEVNP